MRVEIKIDANCVEARVEIHAGEMTDEVVELAHKISEYTPAVLVGYRDGNAVVLDVCKVVRFYAASQKVFAVTSEGEYTMRRRLYELEQQLPVDFVRISNSEIVILKEVKGFDLSFTGTICVKFRDGTTTYVSRRYVSKIKQKLEI